MKLSKEQKVNRLAIKGRTFMDEVVSTIPYPENAIPKNGLPRWDVIPLSQKLPICEWPKGTVEFCRGKVGTNLWKTNDINADFALYDPYCYDVNYTKYNILHDRNLRDFFLQEPTISLLQELGTVSPSLGAYCTLKEFNEFRRYLRRLHMAQVDIEIKRISEEQKIRIALNNAEEIEERDKMNAARNEAAHQIAVQAKNRAQLENKLARKKQLQREREHAEHLKEVEEAKLIAAEQQQARSEAHNEMIKKKQIMSKEIARQKVVDAKVKFLINNMKFKQKVAREKKECEYMKCINLAERWDRTIDIQYKRIAFEDELYKKQKLMNDFNVQMRREIVERRQRKLAKHIEERKYRNKRRTPACTCEIAPPRFAVDKKKLALMRELSKKPSKDPSIEEVETTINTLYGIYIHQNVSQILLDVVRDVMMDVTDTGATNMDADYNIKKKNQNRVYNIYRVDRIDLNTSSSRKNSNQCTSKSAVSFGEAVVIGESCLNVTSEMALRSSKDRPPTPMTSLETLAAIAAESSRQHANADRNEMSESDKMVIDLILDKVKKTLLKEVLRKTQSGLDPKIKTFILAHRCSSQDLDINQLSAHLTKAILRMDAKELLTSTEMKFTSDVLALDVLEAMERHLLVDNNTGNRKIKGQKKKPKKYLPEPSTSK